MIYAMIFFLVVIAAVSWTLEEKLRHCRAELAAAREDANEMPTNSKDAVPESPGKPCHICGTITDKHGENCSAIGWQGRKPAVTESQDELPRPKPNDGYSGDAWCYSAPEMDEYLAQQDAQLIATRAELRKMEQELRQAKEILEIAKEAVRDLYTLVPFIVSVISRPAKTINAMMYSQDGPVSVNIFAPPEGYPVPE